MCFPPESPGGLRQPPGPSPGEGMWTQPAGPQGTLLFKNI